jgi:adenylate cyclase
MAQSRQLAAIMFTDIEGYTAAMQQNEEKALALKDRHRAVLEKEHQHYNGRVVHYYGDGSLSIFQSAVEAVACALAMQTAFRQEPVVPVRMGLHLGDILYDSEASVFGDGVNLASRIESLGVSGSVLISDKLNDEIQNHPELKTVSVGSYRLKNVGRQLEVFALDHEGLVVPPFGSLEGKTEPAPKPSPKRRKPATAIPEKSIAVLPFVNMSNDPEQEYFSEGMAEEILTSLSNLKDLKVAGRTSSFQFNSKNADLREVGEKLGVGKVLEGSVRKQGNRLRVTAQLINTADGFHLWSEKYDRNMDDIFAIQDEIARAITEKLKVTLLGKDPARITRSKPQNTEAYELYLKGRFYINRRGDSILKGIKYFEEALAVDPAFALAHAGFADAHLMTAFYGLRPPGAALEQAKTSAEEALSLDSSLCEPYCSLGSYYTFGWNWKEAEGNFLRSIDINPQYAQAHLWYALNYLAWVQGDFEQAEHHGQLAIKQEPLSPISNGVYGAVLYAAGKFEEALTVCKKGLELDAYSFLCRMYEGNAYMSLERYEDARSAFEKTMKIANRHHFTQNALTICYCKLGEYDKARFLLQDLKERRAKTYIASAFIGLSAAYLEGVDAAMVYLEKAFEDREPPLLTLKHEHWVPDFLKEDPRFQNLLERIGFPS